MALSFLKMVNNTIKYWYLPLISGIVLIAMGAWTFKHSHETYVALSYLFSISFIASGLFEVIFSISNRKIMDNWGWSLVLGIITLVVGVWLFGNQEISMLTLPFFVGFVVLFRSMGAIGLSLDLKSYGVLGWGNILAVGILGIILSFMLLWNPVFAGVSIVVWTGIALILMGVLNIMISLKLKKIHDAPANISAGLKKKFNEVKQEIQDKLDQNQQNPTQE